MRQAQGTRTQEGNFYLLKGFTLSDENSPLPSNTFPAVAGKVVWQLGGIAGLSDADYQMVNRGGYHLLATNAAGTQNLQIRENVLTAAQQQAVDRRRISSAYIANAARIQDRWSVRAINTQAVMATRNWIYQQALVIDWAVRLARTADNAVLAEALMVRFETLAGDGIMRVWYQVMVDNGALRGSWSGADVATGSPAYSDVVLPSGALTPAINGAFTFIAGLLFPANFNPDLPTLGQ